MLAAQSCLRRTGRQAGKAGKAGKAGREGRWAGTGGWPRQDGWQGLVACWVKWRAG